MSDKHYVIDWDKVQTPDDIKRLLAVIDFAFLPDCPGIGNVMDLVVLRDKNPNDLVFTKLEPDKAPGEIVRMDAEGRWSWGRVPSAPLIIDSGSGAVGESMPTHILEVREEEMTKRYTTASLVTTLQGRRSEDQIDDFGWAWLNLSEADAIIARLKAGDELCEAAKEAEVELSFAPCRDNPEHSFCLKCQTTENLRKAIKKHEEA